MDECLALPYKIEERLLPTVGAPHRPCRYDSDRNGMESFDMRGRRNEPIFAILAVLVFSPVILAQTTGHPETKRTQTAVHAPDLTGV
jgi:hypothetical protein